jgi:transposase
LHKRPAILSPTTKNMIKKRMYRKSGSSTRKTAAAINLSNRFQRLEKKISHMTIQRHLKTTTWGNKAFKSPKKPLLSAKNIIDRVKFGDFVEKEGYLTTGARGDEKRRNILFTDESWIYLYPHVNNQNIRYRTEKRTQVPATKTPKNGLKVMVAAGFCSRGVTDLHIIPKGQNLNAVYYRENILPVYFQAMDNKVLFPQKRKVTFMQDGAPAHSEKQNLAILEVETSSLWGKGTWPGNSPDLNPLEDLWAYLKNSAYQDPKPKTREDLIRRFQKKWKEIPVHVLENLAQSFKKRVEEMVTVKGGLTKY